MRANHLQTSFLGGEWSKTAQGRMDDPRYKTALAENYNGISLQEGAWTRRPGTARVGPTHYGRKAVVKKFAFAEGLPFTAEFTEGHVRMVRGSEFVVADRAGVASVVGGPPSYLVLAGAVDWQTGDIIIMSTETLDAAVTYADLRGQLRVTRMSSTEFQVANPVTGVPLFLNTMPSTMGLVAERVFGLSTPYEEDDLDNLRTVQAERDMIILEGEVAPQRLSLEGEDGENAVFEIEPANFLDGPYLDPVPGTLATPSAVSGIITVTLSFTPFEAARAYSAGDFVTDASVNYRSLINQNVGNTPASSPTAWAVASAGEAVGPNGFVGTDIGRMIRLFSGNTAWTWGKIVALATAGVIDTSPANVSYVGNMTNGGSLPAAFDGVFVKPANQSARRVNTRQGWAGVDLGAGNSSEVATAVLYPPTGGRFAGGDDGPPNQSQMTFQLRGSNTAPNNPTVGTLLGTEQQENVGDVVTIQSNDTSTQFRYIWVAIIIDAISSFFNVNFAQVQFFNASASPGSAVQVQVLGPALTNTSACIWRIGAYSDTTGWPRCGCYHEGRLWLSGAIDNRFDASKSNEPYNFEPTNAEGVVADNNAIAGTFNASDVNPIFWMVPGQQGIVCGSQGGEWVLRATQNNNTLTPTSTQAHRVTKYEAANAEPAISGLSTVFIQKNRRRVLEFISDIYSGKFFGPDLNEFSKHMSKTNFVELASQEELTPIVWARRGDGGLRGVTYRRISMYSAEPPKFLAWHKHELGSACKVTSISGGPSADGQTDTLWMVTQDNRGVHFIEYLTEIFDEEDEAWQSRHIDASFTPVGARLRTQGNDTVLVFFSGALPYLSGDSVRVMIGGVDFGEYIVEPPVDGSPGITGNRVVVPLGGDLTVKFLADLTTAGVDYGDLTCPIRSDLGASDADRFYVPVVIGHGYTSRGQMLRPARAEDTGTREGPGFGKTRRSHRFYALLDKAKGMFFGTRFDKLRPMRFRTTGGTDLKSTELFSGVFQDTLEDTYTYDSQPCWEVRGGYPATVNAIGAALDTAES